MCIYIYIYLLSPYIYIYIYLCTCVSLSVCVGTPLPSNPRRRLEPRTKIRSPACRYRFGSLFLAFSMKAALWVCYRLLSHRCAIENHPEPNRDMPRLNLKALVILSHLSTSVGDCLGSLPGHPSALRSLISQSASAQDVE